MPSLIRFIHRKKEHGFYSLLFVFFICIPYIRWWDWFSTSINKSLLYPSKVIKTRPCSDERSIYYWPGLRDDIDMTNENYISYSMCIDAIGCHWPSATQLGYILIPSGCNNVISSGLPVYWMLRKNPKSIYESTTGFTIIFNRFYWLWRYRHYACRSNSNSIACRFTHNISHLGSRFESE